MDGIKTLTPILSFSFFPHLIIYCRRKIALQKWIFYWMLNKSWMHFSYSLPHWKHASIKINIKLSPRLSTRSEQWKIPHRFPTDILLFLPSCEFQACPRNRHSGKALLSLAISQLIWTLIDTLLQLDFLMCCLILHPTNFFYFLQNLDRSQLKSCLVSWEENKE